jgi:hypothetical protein
MKAAQKMDAKTRRERQIEEVDRNVEAFRGIFARLRQEHPGKVALMKDGEVKGIFVSRAEAMRAGSEMFADGFFSAQQIGNRRVDMGARGRELSRKHKLWFEQRARASAESGMER